MPSGVQLSGKKSSIQSGDPAGDQADLLSVCACVFRPDHVLRVPDQRQKTGVFLDPDHLLLLCHIHVRSGAHVPYECDPGILLGYGTDRQHLPAVRHVADPDHVQ